MIKPTVGRVVWWHPRRPRPDDQPRAALVSHVWNDGLVNLAVFDPNGSTFSRTSVDLVQDGEEPPREGPYCEWMPYQKGQAAKTETLEKALSAK